MLKSIAIKRFACILLCLILLFDCTYTKKQEADAFAFVLTPVISKILIASAVACGVRLATDEDAQKFAKGLWDGMSEGLKEIITAQSDFNDVIESGFALWGAAAWNSFTSFLGGFLNIGGGSLDYFIPSLEDKVFNLSTSPMSFEFTYIEGQGKVRDVLNSCISKISGYENIKAVLYQNKICLGIELKPFIYYGFGSSLYFPSSGSFSKTIQLPYIYRENGYIYISTNENYLDINSRISSKFKIINGDVVLAYDHSIVLIPDIPSDMTLDDALWQYFTGGIATTGEVEYVIDVPYFPTAENSICPSVPKDQVMSIPVPGVYNPGAVVGKVGYQDIPASFPLPGAVAPPISPPIDPDAGFLQRVLDWLSSIWSKIASIPGAILFGITSFFTKVFDVTQFKLDFSPLKNAGIQNKFPFCIPFDLYNVLKTVLKPGAVDFHVKLDTVYFKIDYMLPINEPIFQLVRNFFRWSALFGFIISLIRGTKNLIKW